MPPSKARFVTACQQTLALGVVLAVLAPAANVITLDVVTQPADRRAAVSERPSLERQRPAPQTPAPAKPAPEPDAPSAEVEKAPVEPVVREVPMEISAPSATERRRSERPARADRDTGSSASTEPEPVNGYGAVGVTWSPETALEEDDITLRVRTRSDGRWSDWKDLEYHDEHAPDPGSPEARGTRPGTDPLLVGEVDDVQAEAVTADGVAAPADLKLAVVEGGEGAAGTEVEAPAIDTNALEADEDVAPSGDVTLESSEGELALQAGGSTPKPKIFSRAQWGANESLRSGRARYYEVHAGFVHHTVNANKYSRAEVPGIIRSIYAYHTRTRGWSDIGYNFLVDRFGRVWEGRHGGVDRPVVGAHTAGYNDYAFAMSAIGNFDIVRPTSAMLDAYGRVMAWKLSLHGVDPGAASQRVGSRTFPAVNGHRDAGSTACPGRYLYAKLSTIRSLAQRYQADWAGRQRTGDLVGSARPDLVVRRAKSQKAFVIPTEGMLRFKAGRTTGTGYGVYDTVEVSPDLTGDGVSDLFVRNRNGLAGVRPGDGSGSFSPSIKVNRAFSALDQITPVGDLNGDGRNDVVARHPGTGKLFLFRNKGRGGFSRILLSTDWGGVNLTVAAGDFNNDGKDDVLARRGNRLWLHPGTDSPRLGAAVPVNGKHWAQWDVITGFGDYSGDGRADLFVRSAATKKAHVYLGRQGRKVRKQPLGPFGRVGKFSQFSGGKVLHTPDPDLVGLAGDRLVVVAHRGAHNTSPMVRLGSVLAGVDTVLNVGDWNGNGHGDLVSRLNGTLRLHRGNGAGTFLAPVTLATGFGRVKLLEAVGDVTGDGLPDLMGQPSRGAMRIYPGNGATGLRSSYVARSAISASRQLGIGLWDADGSPDNAFRMGNRLQWYRGNGPGGLTGSVAALRSVDLRGYDWLMSPGNVIGNKRSDLVAREAATGMLWVMPGRKNGFGPRKFLAGGFKNYDLGG